ncbi:hypothetical protein ELE36_16160 [Pseudolysobacter antarcticus]|uniref:Uncharacterized protein n=1 Tax=Pseudolysobacter antarcticus TaxID=2511995 RepID=A0A411HMQ7_9GAMM|nr:hypothetical protein [Pseudolysobacter antarcticus]QBB71765.1 hypothetical protein ELE36_16160 [Pseudolysobacter antarcticus]
MSLRNPPGRAAANRAKFLIDVRAILRPLLVVLSVGMSLVAVAATLPDSSKRSEVTDDSTNAITEFYAALPNTPMRTYVTDGAVNAIVRSGDTIYVGGQFSRVGPRTGPGVEVALDGSLNTAMPDIAGAGPSYTGGATTGVRAVISDGAGGWFVGGLFTHIGGIAQTNVAHIFADHSVDPNFHPVLNGAVSELALSGSILYLAGPFTVIDGTARSNIAGYDLIGYVNSFNPYADGNVNALAVSSDGLTVYAGGSFATIGGQPRTGLAALDSGNGSANSSFNPVLAGQPRVSSLAIAGSILYVGGSFSTVNSVPLRAIAALHLGGATDGTVVAGFAPSPSYYGNVSYASIDALAVSGATVFVGGSFDTMGGASRAGLAGLNAANGSATAFDPDVQGNINTLAVSGSTVYVGGGISSAGGQSRNYIAQLNGADGSATTFDPNPNGSVNAIAVTATAVYFGGQLSSIGGIARSSLVAINAGDGTPTAWDPNAQGSNGGYALVKDLQISGNTLYVAGAFTAIGGQPRSNIAAVSTINATASSWNPSASAQVSTIALSGNVLYAGGGFQTIGGQSRALLAALSTVDGTATAWSPALDGTADVIVTSADRVYVGGAFLTVNGEARTRLAAFSIADGSLTNWDPQLADGIFGSNVNALAISGNTIYVGGGYTGVRGVARHNLAGINMSDAMPTPFDPQPNGENNDGAINAITVSADGATVYAGGDFESIGGLTRSALAGLNVSDGSATNFDPKVSGGTIYTLVFNNGVLYAGGNFPSFDLAYQQGLAAFSKDAVFHSGFETP